MPPLFQLFTATTSGNWIWLPPRRNALQRRRVLMCFTMSFSNAYPLWARIGLVNVFPLGSLYTGLASKFLVTVWASKIHIGDGPCDFACCTELVRGIVKASPAACLDALGAIAFAYAFSASRVLATGARWAYYNISFIHCSHVMFSCFKYVLLSLTYLMPNSSYTSSVS